MDEIAGLARPKDESLFSLKTRGPPAPQGGRRRKDNSAKIRGVSPVFGKTITQWEIDRCRQQGLSFR